jgi:hypothetical protein
MITINDKFLGAAELLQGLDEGAIDAIEVMIKLKRLEKQIEAVKETASKMASDEAAKFNEKSFEYHGAKIELAELGTKYKYDGCNYPPYHRASEKVKEASELVKASEGWLKSLKGKVDYIDPDTGEVCEVYPPTKTSTTGIKITLAK